MTKKQKLKKLKEAIISAVPEIIELKMGCRVKLFKEDAIIVAQQNQLLHIYFPLAKYSGLYAFYDLDEILGRTITLEDIFKTYQKNKTSNSCPLSISEKGDLVWEKEICYWEFGKPLDQQAPEVIDFLYNLICKNGKDNH